MSSVKQRKRVNGSQFGTTKYRVYFILKGERKEQSFTVYASNVSGAKQQGKNSLPQGTKITVVAKENPNTRTSGVKNSRTINRDRARADRDFSERWKHGYNKPHTEKERQEANAETLRQMRARKQKNPVKGSDFDNALNKIAKKIKNSQYGLPIDQLNEWERNYLIKAYKHLFDNDNGYIKFTPTGKKVFGSGGVWDLNKNPNSKTSTSSEVRSPTRTETSTDAYTAGNITVTGGAGAGATTKVIIRNPQKRYDIATMLPTTRTGQGTAVYESDGDGYMQFVRGTPCTKCVNAKYSKDRHSICEMMIDAKRKNGASKIKNSIVQEYKIQGYKYIELRKGVNGYGNTIYVVQYATSAKPNSGLQENFNTRSEAQTWIKYALQSKKKNDGASDFRAFTKKRLNDLSAMFQGGTSGASVKVMMPDEMPNKTSRLGYLVGLKIKQNGVTIPIEFDGQSYLSIDIRKNLWISGKDARLGSVIKNALPRKGQLETLGDLVQIDYVTAKNHIEGGKTVRFWHPLGEVTKEYPKLRVDHDGFPLIHAGGYDVWNVGIVN